MNGTIPIDWEAQEFLDFTQPSGKVIKLNKAAIATVSEEEGEE